MLSCPKIFNSCKAPGQTLIIVIVIIFALTILSTAIFTSVANFLRFGSDAHREEQAVNLVEAGIDYAIWRINQDEDYFTNLGGFEAISDFGPGDFHVEEIDPGNGNKKIIVSGFIPKFGSFEQKAKGQVELSTETTGTTFQYAIQSDSREIKLGANRGYIIDSGNANAHSNSNITGSANCSQNLIEGNASAVGTSIDDCLVAGTNTPGANNVPLPTIDVDYWKAQAGMGPTLGNTTIDSGNPETIGPAIIDGYLLIDNDGEPVSVEGPIWLRSSSGPNHDLRLKSGILKPADSLGTDGVVIIMEEPFADWDEGSIQTNSLNGFILIYHTDNTLLVIPSGDPGNELLVLAPFAEVRIDSKAGTPVSGAIAADEVDLRERFIADPDANLTKFGSISGGGEWQIVRGTYKFTR